MDKKLLLLFILCLQHTETLYAQWTEQDSIWLQDVLSGKKDLQLKPEVLKAIEEGSFIRTDPPSMREDTQSMPLQHLISKDFSEYIKPTENTKPTDSLFILPAVFMRLGLNEPLPQDPINKAAYTPKGKVTAPVPLGVSFSASDILNSIFLPSERAKARNRKKANAWKSYNSF
jgi:hypothetical protein